MPINLYQRDRKFFRKKDRVNAYEVDNQFNEIVDYLNSDILTFINELIYNQFQGAVSIALQNTFLINKGDVTTYWAKLNNDNFLYNGLSLSKIEEGVENSCLISNAGGEYEYATPTAAYQTLISVLGSSPVWKKITGDCFEVRSLEGRHVALKSIGIDNIPDDMFAVADNSVPTIKFAAGSVTADNLVDGDVGIGLSFDRLSASVAAVFPTMITSNMIPNDYFNNYFDTIFSGANAYSLGTEAEYARITDFVNTQYSGDRLGGVNSAAVASFSLGNLALNTINGNRLQYFVTADNRFFPRPNELIADGEILPEHLTPALRAQLDL